MSRHPRITALRALRLLRELEYAGANPTPYLLRAAGLVARRRRSRNQGRA